MSHTSFIPPNVAPPEPPGTKTTAFLFSAFMFLTMIAFVGFIGVEFLADMAGNPLNSAALRPPQVEPLTMEQEPIKEIKEPFELVAPKHQTLVKGPDTVVIYTRRLPNSPKTPPDLLIDGVPFLWLTQYGDNTWFARLTLEAGKHRLQVEETEADFFVVTTDIPPHFSESWVWHRPHPDTDKVDRCQDCHVMLDIPTAVVATRRHRTIDIWKGPDSCFACHDKKAHEIRHAVLQSAPDHCLRCHTMH